MSHRMSWTDQRMAVGGSTRGNTCPGPCARCTVFNCVYIYPENLLLCLYPKGLTSGPQRDAWNPNTAALLSMPRYGNKYPWAAIWLEKGYMHTI